MSNLNVGIVYDTTTKTLKRVVNPESDAHLDSITWHDAGGSNESYTTMLKSVVYVAGVLQAGTIQTALNLL